MASFLTLVKEKDVNVHILITLIFFQTITKLQQFENWQD